MSDTDESEKPYRQGKLHRSGSKLGLELRKLKLSAILPLWNWGKATLKASSSRRVGAYRCSEDSEAAPKSILESSVERDSNASKSILETSVECASAQSSTTSTTSGGHIYEPRKAVLDELRKTKELWAKRYARCCENNELFPQLSHLHKALCDQNTRESVKLLLIEIGGIDDLLQDLVASKDALVKNITSLVLPDTNVHESNSIAKSAFRLDLSGLTSSDVGVSKVVSNPAIQEGTCSDSSGSELSGTHAAGLLALLIVEPDKCGDIETKWHKALEVLARFIQSVSLARTVKLDEFGLQIKESKRLLQLLLPDACCDGPPSQTYVEIQPGERVVAAAELLGAGRHGTVHNFKDADSPEGSLVVKCVSVDFRQGSEFGWRLARLYQEACIWANLSERQYEAERCICIPLLRYFSKFVSDVESEVCFVMKRAECNLAEWRQAQGCMESEESLRGLITECLSIARDVAKCIEFAASQGVAHNDIRCDNILVLPMAQAKQANMEEEGKGTVLENLESRKVVLADFGESICATSAAEFSHESRGTECYKSPEMLKVCTSTQASEKYGQDSDFDRRKVYKWGTAAPSDVWSFGCFIFELLTGEHLFQEALDEWPAFFTRLCVPTQEQEKQGILPASKRERLEELFGASMAEAINRLLESILIRDQHLRPSAGQVASRLEALLLSASF